MKRNHTGRKPTVRRKAVWGSRGVMKVRKRPSR